MANITALEKPPYPAWLYHAEHPPKQVANEQEELLLDAGWQRQYIHQEFPKLVYHPGHGQPKEVNSQEELEALGDADEVSIPGHAPALSYGGWCELKAHADHHRAKAAEEVGEKHVAFLRSRGKECEGVAEARKFVKSLTPKQKQKFMAEATAWDPDASDDWENPAVGAAAASGEVGGKPKATSKAGKQKPTSKAE